eukprot:scaffold3548_cov77-Cyclotella_meneghiniana.AAC.1
MDTRDVIKHMPKDFWLHHNKCIYAHTIMCHRHNPSATTVAKQRKDKQERRDKQHEAVKERTADTLQMRAMSPTKTLDLQLEWDMVYWLEVMLAEENMESSQS